MPKRDATATALLASQYVEEPAPARGMTPCPHAHAHASRFMPCCITALGPAAAALTRGPSRLAHVLDSRTLALTSSPAFLPHAPQVLHTKWTCEEDEDIAGRLLHVYLQHGLEAGFEVVLCGVRQVVHIHRVHASCLHRHDCHTPEGAIGKGRLRIRLVSCHSITNVSVSKATSSWLGAPRTIQTLPRKKFLKASASSVAEDTMTRKSLRRRWIFLSSPTTTSV